MLADVRDGKAWVAYEYENEPLAPRLTWQLARVVELVRENARTKTIVLEVPGWSGHLAGQHVDVRLTAEDGCSTRTRCRRT